MEEQIYKRQITKLTLSKRIIDAKQTNRHFEENDLAKLYSIENIEPIGDNPEYDQPKDTLMLALLQKNNHIIYNYHCHDSFLEETEENLSDEDKRNAWKEYITQRDAEKHRMLRGSMKFLSFLNGNIKKTERSIMN